MDTDRSSKKAVNDKAPKKEVKPPSSKEIEKKPTQNVKFDAKPKSLFNYDRELPKQVKDVLQSMDDNQEKLMKIIDKGIKIKSLLEFESKYRELFGVEINPILDFLSYKYENKNDKYILTFADFIDITQKWADSFILKQDQQSEPEVEYDHQEEEKLEMQAKSRYNLVLKFGRHNNEIREIFENYAESVAITPRSDKNILARESKEKPPKPPTKRNTSNNEDNEKVMKDKEQAVNVKLKNIGKIFNDIAYLTGISVMSYDEYNDGSNIKKSSNKAIEEIVGYFWKRVHDEELQDIRLNRKSDGIYKPIPEKPDSKAKLVEKPDSKDQKIMPDNKDDKSKQDIKAKPDSKEEKGKSSSKEDKKKAKNSDQGKESLNEKEEKADKKQDSKQQKDQPKEGKSLSSYLFSQTK